jgi:AAA domain (dynein-related subfamily)
MSWTEWKETFWTRLAGEQQSRRFDMYYAKRDDLRLPVEIVAGEQRVPVDAHVLELLEAVNERELMNRLQDDRQRASWRTNAEAVRNAAGKTVSLYAAVVAAIVPVGAPTRRTLNLNVYASLWFKLDELRAVVDPDVRTALAVLKKQYVNPYEVARALGIETPGSSSTEDAENEEEPTNLEPTPTAVTWDQHHNLIFFGPPGTGKSFQLQQIVGLHLRATDDRVYRVTFHPEYSYFDFVGTYKPRVGWMKSLNDFTDADKKPHANREPRVYYAFEPGPFSRALVHALKNPANAVVVIVEEINRGNCAAIFGDVFQLLDRSSTDDKAREERGRSEYPIVPGAEWKSWLDEELVDVATPCWSQGRLQLPGNLYLYATMNTSDQSLFPMDTAFRRRWGLQYVGVETTASVRTRVRLHAGDREGANWVEFARVLNEAIVEHTRSDDKQMGPWFVQRAPDADYVADVQFRSKVLFYIWSEVFRDAPQKVFDPSVRTYDQLVRRHSEGQNVFSESVLQRLRPKAE